MRGITIHYSNGQTLTVKPENNDYVQHEIMKSSFITLHFSLPEYIELPIGSWIEEYDKIYYLLDLCQPTKHNSENFDYSLTFYDTVGLFHNWIIQLYSDDNRHSIKFSLTGKPQDFLTHIVNSCNDHIASNEQAFSIGDYDDASEQLILFDSTFIFDALNSIATAFNTEWYVTSDRKICLKKMGNTSADIVTIQYGSGFGIKPIIERRNSEQRRIDRMLVQGGDRNIVQSLYGSQYLLLPKNKTIYYDGTNFHSLIVNTADRKYVSDNEGLSIKGQDYDNNAIHSEMGFDGSNIYPSRTGKITKVTWSPNDSNSEFDTFEEADEINSDNDKGLVWCNIYDNTIPSDLDYSDADVRAEGTESISFVSGRLAGRTVEVSQYIHSNREFRLMRITDGGINMPNDTFYPSVDDEYIVFGMQMPQNYVDNASLEMMKESIKQMYEYEFEQVLFSLPIDEIWYRHSGRSFEVGDNIIYKDDNFAPNGLKIRIAQLKQYLSNPYKIELTLSNCRRIQTVKQRLLNLTINEANLSTRIDNRINYRESIGNGIDRGTTIRNKCWTVQPTTPYFKNDEWLVSSDIIIDGILFKAGVTYHCSVTRQNGEFVAQDWIPKSIHNYERLDDLPYLNDVRMSGRVDLRENRYFSSLDSYVRKDITNTITNIQADVRTRIPYENVDILPQEAKNNTIYLLKIKLDDGTQTTIPYITNNGELVEIGGGKLPQGSLYSTHTLEGKKDRRNQIFTTKNKFRLGTSTLYINGVQYFLNESFVEVDENTIEIRDYIPGEDDYLTLEAVFE